MNALMPESYEELFDHVVPVLRDIGLMQRQYHGGSLREKTLSSRTPSRHQ
jgi:hypothetical protein